MNPRDQKDVSDALSASSETVAREAAHLRIALEAASRAPRAEPEQMLGDLRHTCAIPSFARGAYYIVPDRESGQDVPRPGVQLAREAARCLGHVRCGWSVTLDNDDRILLRGSAWDLRSGNYYEADESVPKYEHRVMENGKRVRFDLTRDSRDWRARVARAGAIVQRSALLQVVPWWLVEEGLSAVVETDRQEAERGLEAARRGMVSAFARVGLTEERLAAALGKPVDEADASDLVRMRGILTSIEEGASRLVDHFADALREESKPTKEPEPQAEESPKGSRDEEPEAQDAAPPKAEVVDTESGDGDEAAFLDAGSDMEQAVAREGAELEGVLARALRGG